MKKRVLIIGTGGVGGYFGGRLARAGHKVIFIARGEHLKAIQKQGLRILSPQASFRKKITAQNTLPKKRFDLILLCLKSFQQPAFLNNLKSVLAPDGVALSLQNGLNNAEILLRTLDPQSVIPSFCVLGAFVEKPGIIRHVAAGKIVMGNHPQAATWLKVFQDAEIQAEISAHFRKAQWQKFVWNVGFNGPTALMQQTVGDLLAREEYGRLVSHLIEEALKVAKQEGVLLPKSWARTMVTQTKKHFASIFTSMAIDREKDRPLEVEIFYGTMCRLAKKHSVKAPYHEMVRGLLSSINAPQT